MHPLPKESNNRRIYPHAVRNLRAVDEGARMERLRNGVRRQPPEHHLCKLCLWLHSLCRAVVNHCERRSLGRDEVI